jgi:GMP synthase-like glutamine amidotransferase
MRLGILETGRPCDALRAQFGGYADMFANLFGSEFQYRRFDVQALELPGAVELCDAYLVTGSPAGVYDPLPWIAPLMDFLREAKGRTRLAGICFGHQVMAEAFGGQVIKSPKGWGVGLHTYDVLDAGRFVAGARQVRLIASHQDQVVTLPPGARVLAGSPFTPYAALAYDDGMSISTQPHPEFSVDFAEALIASRMGGPLSLGQGEAAMASLQAPNDSLRVGDWLRDFLRG